MLLVKKQRLKVGITLAKLGELTGIDPSALSRIEHGQRKLTVNDIMRIARIGNAVRPGKAGQRELEVAMPS